jgi:hypothetical protein
MRLDLINGLIAYSGYGEDVVSGSGAILRTQISNGHVWVSGRVAVSVFQLGGRP